MSLEELTKNFSKTNKEIIENRENPYIRARLRDVKIENLVLIRGAMKKNPESLLEKARTQYIVEYQRTMDKIIAAEHAGHSSGWDYGSLINCFGAVFLAHEITGELEYEIETLRPIVEHVEKEYGKYNCNNAEKKYIHELFGL
ncbi:hypothetical protein HN587_02445 [Candidatus Woesearchaeota archaeon]|nr:hypothetical protein [Candidatus Woesearchaeota archaeon]